MLMILQPALSPALKVVDQIAGVNLNHRKCNWVQSVKVASLYQIGWRRNVKNVAK